MKKLLGIVVLGLYGTLHGTLHGTCFNKMA